KGELISNGFNKGPSTKFKIISWIATVPVNTTVQFQLRGADTEANLALKSFVGPDGTQSTNYTTTGQAIWSGHDTEPWIQYRVALTTTDNTVTPVVDNVSFYYNYVPAKPTLTSPANNTWTATNNPTFNWTFIDFDPGNSQTAYRIQTSNNSAFTPPYKDSGNVSTSNQFHSFSAFTDGALYWHVRTRDDDYDWSAYSDYYVVFIDTTDPISSVTTPANNSFINSLPTISGTSSDAGGSGVNFVNITIKNETSGQYWDGVDWNVSTTWLAVTGTTAWSLSVGLPTWSSGNSYTIVSRATDLLNHVEVPDDWNTFTFDALAPSSAVTIPMDNSYLNALPVISGNAADTGGAGLDYVNISIEDNASGLYWNGTDWDTPETWLAVTGTSSWMINTGLPVWVSGNNYTIRPRATDIVPNVETPGAGNTFYFDADMPNSSITAPLNDTWYNSLTAITGTAADTGGAWVDFVNITIKNETSAQYWDGADWNVSATWLAMTGTTA
ncbi:MAG: hypothetical protein KAJ51_05105, partial [Thermoplasmata archaeon]|nr:hypothetical protein [Thermoplasmata archaeon]